MKYTIIILYYVPYYGLVQLLVHGSDQLYEGTEDVGFGDNALGWEGENMRVSGKIFKVVVQTVLIFGLEMWVISPRMRRSLVGFQHRVSQRIVGRNLRKHPDGKWE